MSFMIGDLDLELDVVTNVRVLPHEEFDADWELGSSDFLMQLILHILRKCRLQNLWSAKFDCRVCCVSLLCQIGIEELRHFLGVLCRT